MSLWVGFRSVLRAVFASSILILNLGNLSAQGGSSGLSTDSAHRTLQMQVDPGSRNCPVSMHAQQNGWSDLVQIQHGPGSKPEAPSPARQQIRLKIEPATDQARVVRAKVLVRGTSARQRALKTSAGGASTDITRTLDVLFPQVRDRDSGAQLVLDGFTSITSIVLESITYADLSTWTMSADSSCRTVPDPLMLVDSRLR